MAISTQVSTQPSIIPQPDPFIPGRVVSPRGTGMIKDVMTGEITRFGAPIQGVPMSVVQPKPELPSPYQLLEEQQALDIQRIEDEYAVTLSQLTEKPEYKTETLEREFEIQDRRLQDKFLGRTPEGKTARDQLEEYNEARKQLIVQKEIAALRTQDKIRPEVDKLNMAKQQAAIETQTRYAKKKIELDMIQKLIDAGKIQDPLMGLQQQYEEAGLNVPLSYLRPDPAQELRDLRQLIEYFKNKMDISKSIKEEMGQTLLTLEEQTIYAKAIERHRELMLQQRPELVKRPKLSTANQDVTENKGGTIGSLVGGNKVTKTLDKTGAMTILQEAGGNKELARQIAASRGYKF